MKFLDPACGSGNFLTETYLCLRRLENRALSERRQQIEFITSREELDYIKVSIGQFYGIEINDFAVSVARTALWIAESQMYNETKKIVHVLDDFLPLRSYNHIVEGNALRMNFGQILKACEDELILLQFNPFHIVGRCYELLHDCEELFKTYRFCQIIAHARIDEESRLGHSCGLVEQIAVCVQLADEGCEFV